MYRSKQSITQRTEGILTDACSDHESGGHFPGLENPPALVDDLREIGAYWGTG